jgi:hypothetical protein
MKNIKLQGNISFQTWPYIFQQVPDLNANHKLPSTSSSSSTNNRKPDIYQMTITTSFDENSPQKFNYHSNNFVHTNDYEMNHE